MASPDHHQGYPRDGAGQRPMYGQAATNNEAITHVATQIIPKMRVDAIVGGQSQPAAPIEQFKPQHTNASWPIQSAALTRALVAVFVLIEALIMTLSLVPPTFAARLGWSATDGPFPSVLAPVVTAIFYLLPSVMGFLSRRWEVALFTATLPAWIGITVYTVSSSTRNGIFALVAGAHPSYLVGSLELFAVLGGIGWLARRAIHAVN